MLGRSEILGIAVTSFKNPSRATIPDMRVSNCLAVAYLFLDIAPSPQPRRDHGFDRTVRMEVDSGARVGPYKPVVLGAISAAAEINTGLRMYKF
jgi:hypothetical protein